MIKSAIEAILFSADRPVNLARLKEVLEEVAEADIQAAIDELKAKYAAPDSGIDLRDAQGGYQFTTKRENAPIVQKFLATKPFRLGRSALECLAIIAYRQPVTRADIDKVRGIDSSHLLRTLMERGLVRMAGKAEIPGRPVLYGTTPKFLETVGLQNLNELPPLTELDQLQGDSEDPIKAMEAGLERFLAETKTNAEVQMQATEGIQEIEGMLDQIRAPEREVYESKIHQEVAEENEAARLCWQEFSKPVRKKKANVVTFEELTLPPTVN